MRYLYGPGRHNEHVDPRLVAAWDAHTPVELAAMEPPLGERGVVDFRPMVDSLELALALGPVARPTPGVDLRPVSGTIRGCPSHVAVHRAEGRSAPLEVALFLHATPGPPQVW